MSNWWTHELTFSTSLYVDDMAGAHMKRKSFSTRENQSEILVIFVILNEKKYCWCRVPTRYTNLPKSGYLRRHWDDTVQIYDSVLYHWYVIMVSKGQHLIVVCTYFSWTVLLRTIIKYLGVEWQTFMCFLTFKCFTIYWSTWALMKTKVKYSSSSWSSLEEVLLVLRSLHDLQTYLKAAHDLQTYLKAAI